ncbi:MAG: EAL domain-containing protein [Gammaproteobacteria bacterium]|nr:EAL domain-containing protein [Gammaproteobacteria bacterium]
MDTELTKTFSAGTQIFQEGEPGDCAYIIQNGEIELSMLVNGASAPFATLGKDELFGEMALIDNSFRSASAVAKTDVELLVISRDYIAQKIELSDPTIRMLLQVVLERYRDIHARLHEVSESLKEHESTSAESTISSFFNQYLKLSSKLASAITRRQTDSHTSSKINKDIESTSTSITKENNLRNALKNNEFELYYQPIVNIPQGTIAGCEALIRWNSPTLGFIPPDQFIGLAEKTGLIIPMGKWITEQACTAAREFRKHRDIYMSINLSALQFESESFMTDIESAVKKANINSDCIKLEITESILMSHPELAESALKQLKAAGFSIAIDDFGTGYSSFSYLHRFPIDTLKIDQSFVNAMFSNERSMQIVKTLSILAKNLNMKTIAEGIEDKNESQQLDSFGCDYGQGYMYSRPVPFGEFLELLKFDSLPEE